MTKDMNWKDVLKALAVLAIGWTGLVMLMKGIAEERDLMAIIGVFVGMLAFGLAKKQGQKTREKALDRSGRKPTEGGKAPQPFESEKKRVLLGDSKPNVKPLKT